MYQVFSKNLSKSLIITQSHVVVFMLKKRPAAVRHCMISG